MSPAATTRFRILASIVSLLLLFVLFLAAWLWWVMRHSLPQLDGTVRLPGLSAPVTVERDALGVPTIRGKTRLDVARALGYLHAQDRFFQMDLLRRRAAGELAELFGRAALPLDREARVHDFSALARKALTLLPQKQRALIDAYTAGVNAGLAALHTWPFEYHVLRVKPRPWRPEDTLLVGYAEVLNLQDPTAKYERMLYAIQNAYGQSVLNFLVPPGAALDAALDGSTFAEPPIPGPDTIDLRRQQGASAGRTPPAERLAWRGAAAAAFASGSNAFALAGSRTASGSALLANDMHLHLRVPNIWYRVSLEWGTAPPPTTDPGPQTKDPASATGARAPNSGPAVGTRNPEMTAAPLHRVTGVTLPGIPIIIAGSNGHIAWGFTNSFADTSDVVIVEPSGIDPSLYRNGTNLTMMQERHAKIHLRGGATVDEVTRWTVWGPVIAEAARKRALVLHWVFDNPAAINLDLMALETAPNVTTALALAPHFGMPPQNLIVADRSGTIGWTIAGPLPRRVGFDGRLPAIWAYGDRSWNGFLPAADYPKIISPPSGQLWSANNREVGGKAYRLIGDGGYMAPSRARQIRNDLTALKGRPATPGDLLAIQLDDRAVLLSRWQKLLLATLTPDAVAGHRGRAELRRLVAQWEGRASIDSVAYTLVRRWREAVAERVFGPLFAPCRDADEDFDFHRLDFEEPLWRLVQARPPNFLTPDYFSWNDLLLAAADDVVHWAGRQGRPMSHLTWGSFNIARIEHPFSRFLPGLLARFLDMPAVPLPGDRYMPRVQHPDFGASERFVVSPGHEDHGIFEMPGGESGNPLSPYYRAGYAAWAHGRPTPFLPGPTKHTLHLVP